VGPSLQAACAGVRGRTCVNDFAAAYPSTTFGYRGSVTEAIADPWLERSNGFEWQGSTYTSELVADLMLQLMGIGLIERKGRADRRET